MYVSFDSNFATVFQNMLYAHVLMFLCVLLHCDCWNKSDVCANVKTSLESVRKRRHLTFPKGSNMVLTISLVKAFMTHAPSGWNIALEIDVLFPLPEDEVTHRFFRRKLHHRQKRQFWDTLQSALDFHNINGRSCILKSICEAEIHLATPGRSLIHDLLRVVFKAPLHEEDFRDVMQDYNEFNDPDFCEQDNDCPISLLDIVLSLNKDKHNFR